MNTQRTIVRSSTIALTLVALSGTAKADFQAGPIYVLSPPTEGVAEQCVAVSNDGSSAVLTGTNTITGDRLIWSWGNAPGYTPPSWATAPDGCYYDIRLTDVRVSSVNTFDILAQVQSTSWGSVLYSTSSNPGDAPVHITDHVGPHTGAFALATDPTTGDRRVYGSTVADLNQDGLLDVAACVWDNPSNPGGSPTLLQISPLSDFSVARASSSDGRVVVGTQGRVGRGAHVDMSPEEYSQRATLWIDGQLADTSNLDAYAASSYVGVCDAGTTAMCRVLESDGSSSMLAYDTLTSEARVIDDYWFDADSFSAAMSSDGRVIGGATLRADGTTEATLWTRLEDGSYEAVALSVTLDNLGSTGLDGVDYHSITAVSADGLTVAGTMTLADGSLRVFTASVPTPGTFALLTLGGLAAARRRRA